MRITLDIDTDRITDADKRILAALINGDAAPLVLPREMYRDLSQPGAPLVPADHVPAPAGMPSPTPAPPGFMAKLGEAVSSFAPGAPTEARLPYAQQAGVRTRSTMPDDDGVDGDAADELEDSQAIIADVVESYREGMKARDAGDADAVVVDPDPGPVDWEQHEGASPAEQRAIRHAHGLTPRLVTTDPPVRHTSP